MDEGDRWCTRRTRSRCSSHPIRDEEAVAGVANHLQPYWVPRMRRQIIDYVAAGGEGLHPLAIEAVKRLPAPVVR